MEITNATTGQVKQLMTILRRRGVKPQALQAALSSGAVDDFFEAVGNNRAEVTDSKQPDVRLRRRKALGLRPTPNRGWCEITYQRSSTATRQGFAIIRKPDQTVRAVLYLFRPEDFGLPKDASRDDVIVAGIDRGFEYCPEELIIELIKSKPNSRTRRGHIVVPVDKKRYRLIMIWDTGVLQLQPSETQFHPAKDIPWHAMMAVTKP